MSNSIKVTAANTDFSKLTKETIQTVSSHTWDGKWNKTLEKDYKLIIGFGGASYEGGGHTSGISLSYKGEGKLILQDKRTNSPSDVAAACIVIQDAKKGDVISFSGYYHLSYILQGYN